MISNTQSEQTDRHKKIKKRQRKIETEKNSSSDKKGLKRMKDFNQLRERMETYVYRT
jgi:hypothetical protein